MAAKVGHLTGETVGELDTTGPPEFGGRPLDDRLSPGAVAGLLGANRDGDRLTEARSTISITSRIDDDTPPDVRRVEAQLRLLGRVLS